MNKLLYETKSKRNIIVILYNLSFQLLSPYLDVLLQKIYCNENAVSERSLRINLNDYESPYRLILEEAHQITFHQRCKNSLMIEVFKYLNGHSPDIMNNIFKLRENMYNLQNFHIFQTENPRLLKYGLAAILYRASQLWQQVPIDIRVSASLALFKNCIKPWKCKDYPCRSCKIFIQNVRYI